ncbi:hypothetical protein ACVTMO_08270 [Pseudomonas segetis]
MSTRKGKVVPLCAYDSDAALERLNRLTGLRFSHWPESLVAHAHTHAEAVEPCSAEPVAAESISVSEHQASA